MGVAIVEIESSYLPEFSPQALLRQFKWAFAEIDNTEGDLKLLCNNRWHREPLLLGCNRFDYSANTFSLNLAINAVASGAICSANTESQLQMIKRFASPIEATRIAFTCVARPHITAKGSNN